MTPINKYTVSLSNLTTFIDAMKGDPRYVASELAALKTKLIDRTQEPDDPFGYLEMGDRGEEFVLGSKVGGKYNYSGLDKYSTWDKGVGKRQRAIAIPMPGMGYITGHPDVQLISDETGRVRKIRDTKYTALYKDETEFVKQYGKLRNKGYSTSEIRRIMTERLAKHVDTKGKYYAKHGWQAAYTLAYKDLTPQDFQYDVHGQLYPKQKPEEAYQYHKGKLFTSERTAAELWSGLKEGMMLLHEESQKDDSLRKGLEESTKYNAQNLQDAYEDSRDLGSMPPTGEDDWGPKRVQLERSGILKNRSVGTPTENAPTKFSPDKGLTPYQKYYEWFRVHGAADPKTYINPDMSHQKLYGAKLDFQQDQKDERDSLKEADRERREYIQGLKQEAKGIRAVIGKFGSTSGEWYDWTRWQAARQNQWSGIKGAGSGILPKFLERPIRFIGDATMSSIEARNAPLRGAQAMFQKGGIPILGGAMGVAKGAALTAAGAPFVGIPMAVMGGMSMLQGASQVYGNWGEAKIQKAGFELQTKLNLANAAIGIFKDIHGTIHRIIMAPFKLLGNVLKWSIPIVTGFAEAIRNLTGKQIQNTERLVGRPNLAYTTDMSTADGRTKGWHDYIWSRTADLRSGLQEGTIQDIMENMERTRQNVKIGQIPGNSQIVAGAMLGSLGEVFQARKRDDKVGAWQHFNNFLTQLTDARNSEDPYILNLINQLDPRLEQIVSTLNDAKGMYTDGEGREVKITNLEQLINAIGGGRVAKLTNYWASIIGNPNHYRDTQTEYGLMRNIQDFQKMKIANSWWNVAGRNMELWWIKFLEKLEQKDFPGAGKLIVGGALSIGEFIKDIVIAFFPKVQDPITHEWRAPTLQEGWGKIKEKLMGIVPTVIDLYTSAWVKIALVGYDIISKVANSIWDKFFEVLYNLDKIKFDGKKLLAWFMGLPGATFSGAWSVRESPDSTSILHTALVYRPLLDDRRLLPLNRWITDSGIPTSDSSLHFKINITEEEWQAAVQQGDRSKLGGTFGNRYKWIDRDPLHPNWSPYEETGGDITWAAAMVAAQEDVRIKGANQADYWMALAKLIDEKNVTKLPIGPGMFEDKAALRAALVERANNATVGGKIMNALDSKEARDKLAAALYEFKPAVDDGLNAGFVGVLSLLDDLVEFLSKLNLNERFDDARSWIARIQAELRKLADTNIEAGKNLANRYDLRTISFMHGAVARRGEVVAAATVGATE